MNSIDTKINGFVDTIVNENGIIRSCVGASVDPKDPARVLLTKYNREGQLPIGYAKISSMHDNPETPAYDGDLVNTEHCLLQKTVTKDGNKSLLYMLPIQDKNNNLLGGYLFQKTKIGDGERVEFKGSVSPARYEELKRRQIPQDQWGMTPFVEAYIPIVPDTTLALDFDHYGKNTPNQSTILKALIQAKQQQYGN